MIDWDADPELRELRSQFVDSFGERRVALAEIREKPGGASTASLQELCHKLAGAAESYGFAVVSAAAGGIEDLICLGQPTGADLARFAAMLDEVLEQALALRQDPSAFRADPRLQELGATVRPLAAAAGREA